MSGAGLVVIEATAVERHGRITHGDLGLYSDANERAAARALAAAKAVALPGTKFGVQLAHAGRKASSQRPWEGGGALKADAGSLADHRAVGHAVCGDGWHTPGRWTKHDFARVKQAFVDAAHRAVRTGFDAHRTAHGAWLSHALHPVADLQQAE